MANIKAGRPLAEDLERFAAVRRILADPNALMVDANGAWDRHEASIRVRAYEEARLGYIEEPLAPEDWSAYEELQASARVSIAAGKTLSSFAEFRPFISRRAIKV